MTKNPLPRLMEKNAIGIHIENAGANIAVSLANINVWPNRGEFKRLGTDRKLYLYSGDRLLLETHCYQGDLPDIFGLSFKRVIHTSVDFKSKVQSITAIFKSFEGLKPIEEMHEIEGWNS